VPLHDDEDTFSKKGEKKKVMLKKKGKKMDKRMQSKNTFQNSKSTVKN
jgi:hypothetical protein